MIWKCWILLFIIIFTGLIDNTRQEKQDDDDDQADVLVLTVASNETDGYKRYIRSAKIYGFANKITTLGLNQPWKGGNMLTQGGGYKINLLKKALKPYQNDYDKIIIFTDSYDVIFLSSLNEIVNRFKASGGRIIFSAEKYCWPDKSLSNKYPTIIRGEPYLNSGGFIGYASDLYEILQYSSVKDTDDDQLFYTKAYLDKELREKHKIKLDHHAEIFQNLNGAVGDVELRFKDNKAYLQNTLYDRVPLIVHGNGPSKIILNSLGNYLANAWSPDDGCLNCWNDTIQLSKDQPETYPPIVMGIFVDRPTPFIEEFFDKIYKQAYPKSRLRLFIYNSEEFHEKIVEEFIKKHGSEYKNIKQIMPKNDIPISTARNLAMDYCLQNECSGYFSIDSVAHLENEYTLKLLVEQQRGIVAPLLKRPGNNWSNFWGTIANDGYYARSTDYMDIIENKRRGLWNVPYINNCYLINVTIIGNIETRPKYKHADIDDLDPDMAFAAINRDRNIFMYVSNRLKFGHLVNADDYNIKYTNPDMYELFNNKFDWEKRYIHVNYSQSFQQNNTPIQPCTDVYWFPIFNTRFTKEFIEIMEAFGQWSDGSNSDKRLQGGYENVPTRDIHMNQVYYEKHWLYILKEYVRPLQELVFLGYFHDDSRLDSGYEAVPTRDIHMTQVGLDETWLEFLRVYVRPLQRRVFLGYDDYPPRSLMNFVVRYKPDEQPSLRPHHDSSTYTINIALNQVGVDYEGGGCRFLRYDCAVTDTKPGWMLMHPGRLTHYHEGLKVTRGTRYIMISFVDP